jgi:hypothetical protein
VELNYEIELLYRALASPFGIVVSVASGEMALARQRLYAARREAADAALEALQFRLVVEKEIWIVKASAAPAMPTPADEPTTLEALGL